jgi:hypothetical protein
MAINHPRVQVNSANESLWLALAQLSRDVSIEKWAIIGGQMVQMHASLANAIWPRITTDGDIAVDIRTHTRSAIKEVAHSLLQNGFQIKTSADGISRFEKREAKIDLLAPEGLGARAIETIRGSYAIQAPGVTQALQRTIVIEVQCLSECVLIRIPTLVSAAIIKAAASTEIPSISIEDRLRHQVDYVFLLRLLSEQDLIEIATDLTVRDKERLTRAAAPIITNRNHPALQDNASDISYVLRVLTR